MSSPKRKASPSIRYSKAQFQALRKPAFWVSATFLSLLLVVVWEYWHNPSWQKALLELSGRENNEAVGVGETQAKFSEESKYSNPDTLAAESGYTEEELAAIADIDNVDLLLQGLEAEIPVKKLPQPNNQKNSKKSSDPERETLYDQLVREQEANAKKTSLIPQLPKPKANSQPTNPFLKESQALLNNGGYNQSGLDLNPNNSSGNSFLSSNSQSTTANSNKNPQESTQLTALEQALNSLTTVEADLQTAAEETRLNRESQSQPQTSSTSNLEIDANNGYQPGVERFSSGSNYTTYGQTNSPAQANSFTYFTQPQPGNLAPSPVQVNPGTANVYGQFGSNQRTTVTNSNNASFGGSGVQPSQIQSSQLNPNPSSNANRRRRIPGRYIGGGEINTFSNP